MAADPHAHDLEVASRALSEGDPARALKHVAGAFAAGPFNEEAHALLESLAQRTDILEHLRPDDHDIGLNLVRAFALQRLLRVDDAVLELARTTAWFPDRGLETLLAGWLVALITEGGKLGMEASDQVMRLLVSAGGSTIGLNRLSPGEETLLKGFGDLAAAYAATRPPPLGAATAAGMLRRVFRDHEALAALEEGVAAGDEHSLTQQGLVLLAADQPMRAAKALAAAAAVNPEQSSLVIEQARCWFVAGDFERAMELIAPLLEDEDPDLHWLAEACRRAPAGKTRDRLLLLDARRRTVRDAVGSPDDATANLLREHGQLIEVAVSGWESPSNRLLFALYSKGTCDVTSVSYARDDEVLDFFQPLSVRRGTGAPLWVERDGIVVQGPLAPPTELRATIGRVALGPIEDARELGRRLDPSLAPDIAAALVYPPTTEDWLVALPNVLYLHMIAGCTVLAWLPNPWERTREIFDGIIFGPVDWVGRAAIQALADLAQADPDKAAGIRSFLCEVVDDLVPHVNEPRHTALAAALYALPGVPRRTLEKLKAWEKANIVGEPSKDSAPQTVPAGKVDASSDDAAPTPSADLPPALPVDPWVALAIDKHSTRDVSQTCAWNISRGRQAATDGHRLHVRPAFHNLDTAQATDPAVEVARREGRCEFPDVDHVLRAPNAEALEVDASELREGIREAAAGRTSRRDMASMTLESVDSVLTLAVAGERPEDATCVPVRLLRPLRTDVRGLEVPYLLDAIKGAAGTVRISVWGSLDPVLIERPDGGLATILPISLGARIATPVTVPRPADAPPAPPTVAERGRAVQAAPAAPEQVPVTAPASRAWMWILAGVVALVALGALILK